MKLLYTLLFAFFMGCAVRFETHFLSTSLWFNTDYYDSIDYCLSECTVYNKYENNSVKDSIDYSPYCICMNKCTDGYIDIKTDTTFCKM